jgi:purine-binding chemotaxis protein CheW
VLDLSDNNKEFRVGAVVDRVRDVLTIDDNEIKAVPAMSKDFNVEIIKGIVKLHESFLMLLEVEKVFSDSEIKHLKTTNA